MRTHLICLLATVSSIYCTARTVTWTGSTSTSYFTTSNWNPVTNPAALAQTEIFMIGAGSRNNCIHSDGNAFIRQANYARYTMKQALIPMSRLLAGSNISLEANIASTLPLNLLSFKAQAIGDRKAFLNWKTANEQNNHHFDMERSTDGAAFSYIGKVAATGA